MDKKPTSKRELGPMVLAPLYDTLVLDPICEQHTSGTWISILRKPFTCLRDVFFMSLWSGAGDSPFRP